MAAVQPIAPLRSIGDSPLISGDLWVDIGLEELIQTMAPELGVGIAGAMREARTFVREQAKADDDWAQYAELIDVRFDPVDSTIEFILTGSEEENDAMMALELGSPQMDPKPVLRRSIIGAAQAMNKALEWSVEL